MNIPAAYLIPALVVLFVLGLLLLLKMIFNSVRRRMAQYIKDTFDEKEIVVATTRANFFGIKPKGGRQVRGNGALVLTRDHLVFCRAVPFAEYRIPLDTIQGVSLPRSFNGKSIFRELLCVHYATDGQKDAIGWAVANPDQWKNQIEIMIKDNN